MILNWHDQDINFSEGVMAKHEHKADKGEPWSKKKEEDEQSGKPQKKYLVGV